MLQGDRRHAGTPEDGVISREQIAQVLVTALSNDAAKNKTFELVAERGEAQQDLTPLFAELRNDNPQKNDGVFDIDNMPLTEEPECVINDLNLYSKTFLSISRRPIRRLQMTPVTADNRLNPSTANPSTRREPISRSQDIAILRKVFITYPTVHTVE